jgi:hypothetical protein
MSLPAPRISYRRLASGPRKESLTAVAKEVMGRERTRPGAATRRPGEDLVAWRIRRLTAAGFEPRLARRLASDHRFDLHALLELVDRGCPPELAVRILAPLDRVDVQHAR